MKFEQNFILYLAFGLFILIVLPILAPIFAYVGLELFSDTIYSIYQWFCHQRPWRSYHLFDYQYAMDARMMFMFLSMAISSLFIYFKRIQSLPIKKLIFYVLLMTLPLAIDGTIQAIAEISIYNDGDLPFYESTNLIRSITGALFGVGIAYGVFPLINSWSGEEKASLRNINKYIFTSLGISLLFIPVFVVGWQLTSIKYLPSTIIVDNIQRFPGFNYEITTSGMHSTINRSIKINDIEIYVMRAEKFSKKELLEDYYNSK